nr:right-handed parallel beta-helix repeat-containing protein [Armatimonadota bacterium]
TDYNLACSSVTFRKCRIQALRARGLNLKAQNCLIEDCLFYDCPMPAVSGGPEMWWGEGPALHKFTVRNNRFINCNTRCIDIAYFDGGSQCIARENRDILIEGNTFIHWGAHDTIHRGFIPQCPIRISNADGVTIRNNTFADPVMPDKPVRVLIENSNHVFLEGNHNLPDGAVLRR